MSPLNEYLGQKLSLIHISARGISHRSLLRAATLAGLAAPLGMLGSRVLAANGAPRTYKIAWSQTAVCQSPVSVALERGFFDKYNLKVERINFSGSTDQLLEAIATGHADGGIGMALRWLKPLEQGFDVKLAVGTHGGCMRLLTSADSPVRSVPVSYTHLVLRALPRGAGAGHRRRATRFRRGLAPEPALDAERCV